MQTEQPEVTGNPGLGRQQKGLGGWGTGAVDPWAMSLGN